MRIGIDARFYGSIGKGLGRYTQKLIEHLEKIDAENEYFVFLRRENFDEYQPAVGNFHKVLADYQWYTLSEQLRMPRLLKKHKLDLVHFPHFNVPLFYRQPFVVTIHDLILLHFPTARSSTLPALFYWLKFVAYKLNIRSAIRRARAIIAVSGFTKEDILAHYPEAKNKIFVTHEAVDDFCRYQPQNDEAILAKYGIIKPYVLYVGNAYPHKNLARLIEAFGAAKFSVPHRLVIVGKEDYFFRRLKKKVAEEKISRVVFTGFVLDSDLDAVYRHSCLFAFPSLYEGFGLPPLEAMARSVAVVSSDHPCMREVLGDAALYADGENVAAFRGAMERLVGDEPLRNSLIEKGHTRIASYSWERMAQETKNIYVTEELNRK